ncbi:MAG TPA: hypothetical protein VLM85_05190 [Polyangiaceae bacterium]|nr:hypothetical protein [Polyangiaceae bacterium]
MMRWAPHVGWIALCAVMVPTSCSSNGAVTDAGSDAFVSTPCKSSADCPTGTQCLYPASAGCSATLHCLPAASPGACKAMPACSCSGTPVAVCNGGSSAPVAYLGACQIDAGCGGCGGSSLCCELCDVSGYTPTPTSPPVVSPNACSPSEISGFVTACLSASATQQTCDAWKGGEPDAGACLGCVFTLQSAPAWGALVCTSTALSSCSINIPGCVDLELGQVSQEKQAGGAGSCGDILGDAYGCEDYSCATCSTVGGASSDFSTCVNTAMQAECKAYVDKVDAAPQCAAIQPDAATAKVLGCFPQSASDLASFVNVFCGSGP